MTAIASVERLLRYCRDLHLLANNFVSFRDFYTRKGKATFQAGTLYLDGRSCDLCVPITDVGKHAAIATLSRVCLVYCDCVRRGGGEKTTIAAAFTAGDSDFLTVGRNGVFYDRKGQDWDATIVRILEHPISVRQAFWAPYKRLARLIGDQMQKISAARSKAADDRAALQAISATQNMAAGKPAPPPPPPFDVAKFAGIFAAIGLAIGAIGTMLAAVLSGILKLPWWQFPIVIAVIILVISIPSVLLAWLKLRKRNIGPILDANGWAVNARARINIPFGSSLTAAARLPENAERSLADPFAEKKRPWKLVLALAALLAAALALWRQGYLARWFGEVRGRRGDPQTSRTTIGAPPVGSSLDHETVQGHRLDVREEGVPCGVDRLPGRIGVETIPRSGLLDPQVAYPQQEPSGVLPVDELLKELEQEEIQGAGGEGEDAALPGRDRPDVLHHRVQRRVGRGEKRLLLCCAPRLERHVRRGDLFQVSVRRGHPFTLPTGSRRTTRRLSPARSVASTTSSTFL